MGVLRRIADAARTSWDRKMRIGDKPISELTDRELEAELLRRRRLRAGSSTTRSASTLDSKTPRLAAVAQRAQARQWYANLELAPGASRAEIEAAYEKLMARYDPAKHVDDPAKHAAATELARGLTEAYQGLLAHLAGR